MTAVRLGDRDAGDRGGGARLRAGGKGEGRRSRARRRRGGREGGVRERRLRACHTLADASAGGTVGPNLDEAKPSAAARRRAGHERDGRDAVLLGRALRGADRRRRGLRRRRAGSVRIPFGSRLAAAGDGEGSSQRVPRASCARQGPSERGSHETTHHRGCGGRCRRRRRTGRIRGDRDAVRRRDQRSGGILTLVSNTGDAGLDERRLGCDVPGTGVTTFSSITTLSTEFDVTDDDCIAGSPRFQVRVQTPRARRTCSSISVRHRRSRAARRTSGSRRAI